MGGIAAKFTQLDWERAIRHGVAPDGRPLRFMPSEGFVGLSDEELTDIVAYVRNLPAVTAQPPETSYGWLIRGLYVAGIMPLLGVDIIKDHNAAHVAMKPEATVAY